MGITITRSRPDRHSLRRAVACALTAAAIASPAVRAADDGSAPFARCVVCHQSGGEGIPATFPSLLHAGGLAATEAGRTYLALVISVGLVGTLTTPDGTFRGSMPAQSVDDAEIAAVLNHVVHGINGAASPAFTAEEVAGIRAAHSASQPWDVARMRPIP